MTTLALGIEIPDNTATGAALANVNRVYAWLQMDGIARGQRSTDMRPKG